MLSDVGVLVPTCSKSRVLLIAEMRKQGYQYKAIARKVHRSVTAVNRYHRVYEKFGIDVFADDKK